MSVSRSPFSKNNLTSGGVPPTEPPKPNFFSRRLEDPSLDSGIRANDDGLKSTVRDERRKLDSSYDTALAKIARSSMDDKDKDIARQALNDIYTRGNTDVNTGAIKGGILGRVQKDLGLIYKPHIIAGKAAGKALMKVAESTAPVARGVQSAAKEYDDLLRSTGGDFVARSAAVSMINPAGLLRELTDPFKTEEQKEKDKLLPKPSASFDDWLKQTRDKDFRVIRTGRSYIDGTLDFVLDVATDPITYVTFGAGAGVSGGVQGVSYVGRAGRLTLAQRMLTKDMVQKYPELIGKFDDIASVGVGAIPKHIRKAEGIEMGVRFAGQAVPKTDSLAAIWGGKQGVGTQARFATRKVVDKATGKIVSKGSKLDGALTPSSRKVVNALKIGRGYGLDDNTTVQGIAEYSAAKTAKGFKASFYNQSLHEVQGLLKRVKDSGVEDKIIKVADNPALIATEPNPLVRELATEYRKWQDDLLGKVNAVRTKFNADYGADMKLINTLDDYGVHHKMSNKAFRFAYGSKSGISSGWFKDADLLPDEIGGKISAAMHRKYTKGEDFMGETLQEGTIDEINRIFRTKYQQKFNEVPDFDFFETDLSSIADSYAYSMAAARSREAYVRRLLDYGNDVAQVINKKLVPDDELVSGLTGVYNGLKSLRTELLREVNGGQRLAGRSAKEVLDFAKKALDEKDTVKKGLDRQANRVYKQLLESETRLADVYAAASKKSSDQRGVFLDIHAGLIEEITNLKGAIESGRVAEDAAYSVLKTLYLSMNPDAKSVPKSATVLYDRIARKAGIRDSAELTEIQKRLDAVRKQISEYDDIDPQDLNDFLDIEQALSREVQGFNMFEDIRQEAGDYAEDGLLFGVIDDIMERPFDPNNEPSLRLLSTRLIPDSTGFEQSDELAALMNAARTDPNSVAVHALTPDEFFDMRQPENFLDFWNPEAGSGDAVAYAMRQAGLDDSVFKQAWDDVLNGVSPDPMLKEIYPEVTRMTEYFGGVLPRMEFPDGVVEDAVNKFVFENIDDMFRTMLMDAGANADEAIQVSRQMMNDFHLAMVAENEASQGMAVLFPSPVFYGEKELADGAYSLLLPDSFNYSSRYGSRNLTEEMMNGDIMSPVHFTAESDFVAKVLDNVYHSEAIDAQDVLAATIKRGEDLEGQLVIKEGLQEEAKSLSRKAGGVKAAGSRRVKAAEKALAEYQETGLLSVVVNGQSKKVTREEALKVLGDKETKLKRAQDALEKRIAANMDSPQIEALKRRRIRNEERLGMLFDQQKVIQRWNDNVGDALRADIEFLQQVIADMPPTGVAGTNSRAWAQRFTDTMNNIDKLGDTPVGRAWERVSTQLGADEARLAELEMIQLPEALMNLQGARAGINGKLVDDIYDGWTALRGTGVQIPEEFDALIRPNIDRLKTAAGRNEWIRAYQTYNQIFKTYATMTPGFIVRNAMSATFMNKVAGVSNKAISDGTKAVTAYHRFGPNKWLDELGITDVAEREMYESAMRSVMAGGRGIQNDFNSPVVRDGAVGKVASNWATKKFMKANEITEDALRLPVALDTLRKGGTFDEAVYRITRYHFDYTDLSKFDETMKNFIPFWIWTTRNLPLQITEQLMRPSAYNAYNNIKERHPVSADLMLPSWMQEVGAMGLGGRFVTTPDMPFNRLDHTIESFGVPRIFGQANPLIKLIPELFIADKQLALDIPFTDKYEEAKGLDKAVAQLGEMLGIDSVGRRNPEGVLEISPKVSYAMGNIFPPIATTQRLSGGSLGGKSTYQERQLSSWLNFLGIPIREVGPRQERSETVGRQFKIGDLMKSLSKKVELGD
jgi:hypothetical protein